MFFSCGQTYKTYFCENLIIAQIESNKKILQSAYLKYLKKKMILFPCGHTYKTYLCGKLIIEWILEANKEIPHSAYLKYVLVKNYGFSSHVSTPINNICVET